jgi:hypothetical protein
MKSFKYLRIQKLKYSLKSLKSPFTQAICMHHSYLNFTTTIHRFINFSGIRLNTELQIKIV